MTREETLSVLHTQFDQSAKQLCDETNGLYCEISSTYKGDELPQNLQYRFAKIYYNLFTVKFTYTAHGLMNTVYSILGCTVSYDKTENALEIPLPLLADYCDITVVTPTYIPFVSDKDGMAEAFSCIGTALQTVLPAWSEIRCDSHRKATVLTRYAEEVKYILDLKDAECEEPYFTAYVTDFVIDYFTLRFSTGAFFLYMKGNIPKAIKQVKKVKRLTGYEKRLLAVWSSGETRISLAPAITQGFDLFNESGVPKANFKEFGTLFLSWLLVTPITSMVYIGLFFLLVWIDGLHSAYVLGPMYNFPNCILFGFITAIALSYFTRFTFYQWFHKKDYERYCELDWVQNGGREDRFMKWFLRIILLLGIVGCLFLAKWNLNFMSNGFIDNSKFFSLNGEYHAYRDVEKIYYKPDRLNGLGDTIDFPSYVIVLKNGTEIDLYDHGEIADYEDTLLPFLRRKGIPVEKEN